jgi:hypothetical protein
MLMKLRGDYPIKWMGFNLREFMFHVIWIHCSYLFLGGCSEDFDDFDKLVDARFTREER